MKFCGWDIKSALSEHLGIRKTFNRNSNHFFWTGINVAIKTFVRSGNICQKLGKSRIPKPSPLINLPILNEPFERLGIDIIGPLSECRELGNRFVLSVIDLCTHYPISIPLKRHTAVNISNALLNVFCHYGFCKEILSDQGSVLSSHIIKEVLEIFKIKHLFSTIYHPQRNECIEMFGRILKSMPTALTIEFPES